MKRSRDSSSNETNDTNDISDNNSDKINNNNKTKRNRLDRYLNTTPITFSSETTYSGPIKDRQSTFFGYFVPLSLSSPCPPSKVASLEPKPSELINKTIAIFKAHPDHEGADHIITAWRLKLQWDHQTDQQHWTEGCDDDGERFAGKKLLSLLTSTRCEGIAACVRYYGGIMLGPIRFEHITNAAMEAIQKYKQQEASNKAATLNREQQAHHAETIVTLHDLDATIRTLRQTLSVSSASAASFGSTCVATNIETDAINIETDADTQVASDAHNTNHPPHIDTLTHQIRDYSKASSDNLSRLVAARHLTIKALERQTSPSLFPS